MSRIVSIHLPRWPIERLMRGRPAPAAPEPFALAAAESHGLRITAVDETAAALGLAPGESLTDARARVPHLRTEPAQPEQDRAALIKLARWMTRFTPWAAAWPEEWNGTGLFLDITGSSHLFGGEAALAALILEKLQGFGLTARLAIADAPGAGYGLTCHGNAPCHLVAPGQTAEAVRTLPVDALRIPEEIARALRHLGLKRIGDLMALPRAPLTSRFGATLLHRLDQMLGREPEPISPLSPAPVYRTSTLLAEPICRESDILIVMRRLARELIPALERDGKGARALRLCLYRVDGELAALEIRLAQPCLDGAHIEKLFALRLDTLKSDLDAGFGYDAALLEVLTAEPLAKSQAALAPQPTDDPAAPIALLIDRLGTRLGVENVQRLFPQASHIPERAVIARPALHRGPAEWEEMPAPRPLLMLPAAEPAEVIASFPDGPPRQFRWRGVRYGIAHAEGPERIRPEWWRHGPGATRDYYILEDEAGRRFWLYRDGLYGEEPAPHWFVHGVFA